MSAAAGDKDGPARVLSLSKARKARARADKRATADANSVAFGRSKAERRKDAAETALARGRLDGARREPSARPEGPPAGEEN